MAEIEDRLDALETLVSDLSDQVTDVADRMADLEERLTEAIVDARRANERIDQGRHLGPDPRSHPPVDPRSQGGGGRPDQPDVDRGGQRP